MDFIVVLLAAAGVLATAVVDWSNLTAQAGAGLALAGLVGAGISSGIHYAVSKYDQIKIGRKKLYDEANKVSLSAQIEQMTRQFAANSEESLANQERMRQSLHRINNEAQAAAAENHELREDLGLLRGQFMEISKQLHATDLALHEAHDEMRKTRDQLRVTTEALAASERAREALRLEVDGLRERSRSHDTRIQKLEHGADEAAPVSGPPATAPAP